MEDSIDIECYFITGSDAQGCKVVVVSDYPSVGNITAMLIRHNESDSTVSGQVKLTYHIDCYHHVLAFDIEANGTISSLATRREIDKSSEPQCAMTTTTGVSVSHYLIIILLYQILHIIIV